MTVTRCLLAVALAALLAPLARATPPEALRATLARLQPHTPFTASVKVTTSSTSEDDKTPRHAHANLHIATDRHGLHIDFPNALMQRVARESKAQTMDPDAPTPTVDLLHNVDPLRLKHMTNIAPVVLATLHGATLLSQQAATYAGKPVQHLQFKLPLAVGKESKKAIKDYTGLFDLWVAADGTPVAMTQKMIFKGRKFFISFKITNTIKSTFRRVGSRLVATSREIGSAFSGFGQDNQSTTKVTLTPSAASIAAAMAAAPAAAASTAATSHATPATSTSSAAAAAPLPVATHD